MASLSRRRIGLFSCRCSVWWVRPRRPRVSQRCCLDEEGSASQSGYSGRQEGWSNAPALLLFHRPASAACGRRGDAAHRLRVCSRSACRRTCWMGPAGQTRPKAGHASPVARTAASSSAVLLLDPVHRLGQCLGDGTLWSVVACRSGPGQYLPARAAPLHPPTARVQNRVTVGGDTPFALPEKELCLAPGRPRSAASLREISYLTSVMRSSSPTAPPGGRHFSMVQPSPSTEMDQPINAPRM